MKTIKLTESQFNRLMEANGSGAPNFNGGDLKEYLGSEVSTTANISNQDGEMEYGKPMTTDELQDDMTVQNFWASLQNGRKSMY